MKRLKYVIINETFPILFGECHKHQDFVANRLGTPTSAGFCTISQVGDHGMSVSCFGKSVGLNLESKPDDERLIERLFNEDF